MNRFSKINYGLLLLALAAAQCSVFEPPNLQTKRTNEGGINTSDAKDSGNSSIQDSGTPSVQDGGTPSSGDGGAVVGNDAGPIDMGPLKIVIDENGCESVRAPTKADRPDSQNEGESLAPIYFAMSRMRSGTSNDDEALTEDTDAWLDIGVDRDGRCTNSPTCTIGENTVNDPSCIGGGGVNPEGNRCIDNAMGNLFAMGTVVLGGSYSPREFFGMSDPDWNCELHRGGFSIIFKVSDYNGQKNDPFVRLDMYVSIGLQDLPMWTCRETIESSLREDWYRNPPWHLSTHWKIARRSISLSATSVGDEVPDSKTFDAEAFVRDGFLFAELNDGQEFALAGDRTPIPGIRTIMHKPIVLARLFRDSTINAWGMDDGILSFYVKPEEFIAAIRGFGFCENLCGTYTAMVGFLEAAQDVLLTGASQPNAPCTALSFAADFEASQATATKEDIEDIAEPVDCPEPRHSGVPRQNCDCQGDGTCIGPLADAGM